MIGRVRKSGLSGTSAAGAVVRRGSERSPRGMRAARSGSFRRIISLLTVLPLLTSTAGEGFGLHPCPHHAAHVAATGGDTHGHSPVASEHRGSGSDDAAAGADCHDTSGAAPTVLPDLEPCDHFNVCNGPPALSILAEELAITFADHFTETPGKVAADDRILPVPPAHLLPYAQAPPATPELF